MKLIVGGVTPVNISTDCLNVPQKGKIFITANPTECFFRYIKKKNRGFDITDNSEAMERNRVGIMERMKYNHPLQRHRLGIPRHLSETICPFLAPQASSSLSLFQNRAK